MWIKLRIILTFMTRAVSSSRVVIHGSSHSERAHVCLPLLTGLTELVLDRTDFKWCVYKQQPTNRRPLMCQHGRKISHKRLCEVRRLSETNNAVCNTWGVKTDWILCHKFKRRISLFDASQRGIKFHILHGCVLAEQFLLNVYIKVIWNSRPPPPPPLLDPYL